jgi:pyridoxal/pyridoxine/pyridoxamine kinase
MNYSQDQTQKEIAKQFSLNGSDTIFASYFGKWRKVTKIVMIIKQLKSKSNSVCECPDGNV